MDVLEPAGGIILVEAEDEDLLLLVVWAKEFARREVFNEFGSFGPEDSLSLVLVEWKSGGRDAFFFNLFPWLELNSFFPKNLNADTEEIGCWDIFVEWLCETVIGWRCDLMRMLACGVKMVYTFMLIFLDVMQGLWIHGGLLPVVYGWKKKEIDIYIFLLCIDFCEKKKR